MRIAALYDIHGNLPALDAVLADARRERVDLLVIGGDVYPGPMAHECVDRILSCGIPYRAIAGNGERGVLEATEGKRDEALPGEVHAVIDWSAATLTSAHARVLREWPPSLRMDVPGVGRVLFVHATPANDVDIFTERTPEDVLRRTFAGVDADVVLCGHTHIQFTRDVDACRIVNAGSVGMPFDAAGAYWALIDSGVDFRVTPYAADRAAQLLRQSDYPSVATFVDRYVLNPPTRSAMLDFYNRLEGGPKAGDAGA